MEQRRTLDINMHHNNKKAERPKSTFLSWILKSSVTSATVTKEENEDNDSEEARMIKSSSNKIEMRDWDQHNNMMNSSFSTPTAIGSYTQLNYHVKEKKSLPPPPPPHINTNPNIIVNHHDHQQVEIPNRRQSNLYTPFHDNNNVHLTALQSSDNNKIFNNNNRRSYYVSNLAPIDTTISHSSLSRSATWQPSTSSTLNNNNEHNYNNDIPSSHTSETNHQQQHYLIPTSADIPTRRTSRNYANNPEVQAKLDAMLNSDRTLYLSTVLHNNSHMDSSSTNNNNASIIYRRSTTPGNRII